MHGKNYIRNTETVRSMTVSEKELEKYRQTLSTLAPQMTALQAAWQPLQQMMQEFFEKLGVVVKTNKMIYLRNKGILAYGIVFEGPQNILDQIAVQMSGKALHIKEAEETDVGGEEG
ncbi:MAG: hypothetical protein QXW98_04720 [Candidatus Caldarchaeum sp.]